jgi:hypothetical protein
MPFTAMVICLALRPNAQSRESTRAPLAAAWPRALVARVGALTGFSDPMDAWTSVGPYATGMIDARRARMLPLDEDGAPKSICIEIYSTSN